MFSSIPKLYFKLTQYSLFIHKVNGETVYDLQFVQYWSKTYLKKPCEDISDSVNYTVEHQNTFIINSFYLSHFSPICRDIARLCVNKRLVSKLHFF